MKLTIYSSHKKDYLRMKRNLLKTIFLACSFFLSAVVVMQAQGPNMANSFNSNAGGWSANAETQKLFIENKGQFKVPAKSELQAPVHFAYDDGSTKILFTPKGLVYYFSEAKHKEKDAEEIARERKKKIKDIEEFIEEEKRERIVAQG